MRSEPDAMIIKTCLFVVNDLAFALDRIGTGNRQSRLAKAYESNCLANPRELTGDRRVELRAGSFCLLNLNVSFVSQPLF
jgi:hypothetical protein